MLEEGNDKRIDYVTVTAATDAVRELKRLKGALLIAFIHQPLNEVAKGMHFEMEQSVLAVEIGAELWEERLCFAEERAAVER